MSLLSEALLRSLLVAIITPGPLQAEENFGEETVNLGAITVTANNMAKGYLPGGFKQIPPYRGSNAIGIPSWLAFFLFPT